MRRTPIKYETFSKCRLNSAYDLQSTYIYIYIYILIWSIAHLSKGFFVDWYSLIVDSIFHE